MINKARRVRQVYTCIPEELNRREADPFDYKLRSLAEVEEQMKYFKHGLKLKKEQRMPFLFEYTF